LTPDSCFSTSPVTFSSPLPISSPSFGVRDIWRVLVNMEPEPAFCGKESLLAPLSWLPCSAPFFSWRFLCVPLFLFKFPPALLSASFFGMQTFLGWAPFIFGHNLSQSFPLGLSLNSPPPRPPFFFCVLYGKEKDGRFRIFSDPFYLRWPASLFTFCNSFSFLRLLPLGFRRALR